MSEITNPHDRFFKEMFSRSQVAQDFVTHYLPPEISETLAPETLRLRKDSFVDERLPGFFGLLRAMTEQSTLAFLRTAFQYIGVAAERVTNDVFRKAVKAALPQTGETQMNWLVEELIADRRVEITKQAMAEGLREGMKEGREQGITEGRRREAASLTIRLLTRKVGALDMPTQRRIEDLPLENLEGLGEALLDFSDYSDLETWLNRAREAH